VPVIFTFDGAGMPGGFVWRAPEGIGGCVIQDD